MTNETLKDIQMLLADLDVDDLCTVCNEINKLISFKEEESELQEEIDHFTETLYELENDLTDAQMFLEDYLEEDDLDQAKVKTMEDEINTMNDSIQRLNDEIAELEDSIQNL